MGEVARLVDAVAHRYARGRWLATGGGGYDAYRVVPRMWSLVWLAGAHREVPDGLPEAWRERWAADGLRYGQAPLPERFVDPPNAGLLLDASQTAAETHSAETAALVRRVVVPALLREGRDRGWWDPLATAPTDSAVPPAPSTDVSASPTVVADVDAALWDSLSLAPSVLAPASPFDAHALVAAGLNDGLRATIAIAGTTIVGAALTRGHPGSGRADLLALGVAPGWRRCGLATRVLAAHVEAVSAETELDAVVTVAERDPLEPLDGGLRREIARRILTGAGFEIRPAVAPLRAADPAAFAAHRQRDARRG
jgi:ribosomal protein S18 acetylase RimI-like enzyme